MEQDVFFLYRDLEIWVKEGDRLKMRTYRKGIYFSGIFINSFFRLTAVCVVAF